MSDTSFKQDLLNNLAHEFAERCRRGERPSLAEYTARHPELAAEIRDVFPAVLVMEEFGSVADQAGTPPSPPLGGCLGDFRLVREVGRGGMGIVYEAEQISLDRRVALKVLPFAAAVDARQLQRFKIEVQAAACASLRKRWRCLESRAAANGNTLTATRRPSESCTAS